MRIILVCLCLLFIAGISVLAAGGSISGVIKDPNGALVVGAQITVTNTTTGESKTATTDNAGSFKVDNLAPGTYSISVTQNGFKKTQQSISVVDGQTASTDIKLEIDTTNVTINVGKGNKAGNTDASYRQLRDEEKVDCYTVENLVLKRDVGTITLRKGVIGFLPPVLDKVAKAVFVGDGEFGLVPATKLERDHMRILNDSENFSEAFNKLVLYFSDSTYQEIKDKSQPVAEASSLRDALHDFNSKVRYAADSLENIDGEMLIELMNPKRAGSFNAYINGQKHHDLRFHLRPGGVIKAFSAPEEVALLGVDPNSFDLPFWYLAHRQSEYQNGTANSREDKRIIHTEHYKIETIIDKGQNLTATAELTFTSLLDGDRVVRFGLLPRLRVSNVVFGGDKQAAFIQEDRKSDGTFYVILPEPTVAGQKYKLTIEYRGSQVVQDAGGGNFSVGARTSWYPSSAVFDDRATYDLTFKVPHQFTLVGVGKLVKESIDGDYAVSQWVSDVPLTVAGFNYGLFKKKEIVDTETKYKIEGYATSTVPDSLRAYEGAMISGSSITPSRLLDNGMIEAQNSMRLFTTYFGEAPYGRIAITQQPQFSFGQSWPTLVYLPLVAFMDSTTRYMLFQRNSTGTTDFVAEVTPHEVSHQWWGHIVCWSSYHDQWLSEGFADFSAGLYLQHTEKPDKYIQYWMRQRDRILQKNQYGVAPNDAGPIWMGIRLISRKNPGAYQNMIYPKGGYILHMLRAIMWDNKAGDEQFIAMMKDFVKSHFNENASTEDFKKVVERHMTPAMDLDQNGRMDWFFNQWVYGSEVPHYKFSYKVSPSDDGKFILEGTLTQSGVSDGFKMLVPVYGEFDGKFYNMKPVAVMGNNAATFKIKIAQQPKSVTINHYHDILSYDK